MKMILQLYVPLALWILGVHAQSYSEPPLSKAGILDTLSSRGVNIESLRTVPELSDRAAPSFCSAAVCETYKDFANPIKGQAWKLISFLSAYRSNQHSTPAPFCHMRNPTQTGHLHSGPSSRRRQSQHASSSRLPARKSPLSS